MQYIYKTNALTSAFDITYHSAFPITLMLLYLHQVTGILMRVPVAAMHQYPLMFILEDVPLYY
ncbi:MAG: hypothetical protein IT249_05955 [Chitinophagaceae bacterium]|nr:hypothetical protein [Chitinophagaceae bacterium]